MKENKKRDRTQTKSYDQKKQVTKTALNKFSALDYNNASAIDEIKYVFLEVLEAEFTTQIFFNREVYSLFLGLAGSRTVKNCLKALVSMGLLNKGPNLKDMRNVIFKIDYQSVGLLEISGRIAAS